MRDVAAIVLAAGRGTRFGAADGDSKLLARHDGAPLVARVVATALASRARPVVVVTGHAAEAVTAALAGLAVTIVHNAAFADGMAGSLQAGLAALPATSDGALVMLADMPLVAPATLDALIAAFGAGAPDAVVPTFAGRRGNPVLVGRGLFSALHRLRGDEGARRLLQAPTSVALCPVDDAGVVVDVDTREALDALQGTRPT